MANRYWVGNSGNWSDNTNHWSASTGGAAGASKPSIADDVIFDANSFTTGSQTVTIDEDAFCLDMIWTNVTNLPTLDIVSPNTVNVYGQCDFVSTSKMVITGSGIFGMWGSGKHFYGNSQSMEWLWIGNTTYIHGDNTITNLHVTVAVQGIFESGSRQFLTDLHGNGVNTSPSGIVYIRSLTAGSPFYIEIASGTINKEFYHITDSVATGGATFNATNSIDNGGNTGWNFGTPSVARYWVGDGGNWTDYNHWSLTSGGTGGESYPTASESAIFDINSFSIASQTVTLNTTGNCLDMDWTGVTNTPRFNMTTYTLNVYGDATFYNAMLHSRASSSNLITKIIMHGENSVFSGRGLAFGVLVVNNSFMRINDSSSYWEIRCAGATNPTIEFEAGMTSTVRRFGVLGTVSNAITLISSVPTSSYTIAQDFGTVTFDYCNITDCTATGGIAFNAYNSTNVSNNTGINFLGGSPTFGGRYFVSIDGNDTWSDTNAWSTVSGGCGGASLPIASNDVFFDINTTDVNFICQTTVASNYCKNFDFTGLNYNVDFYSSDASIDNIYISGNAIFNSYLLTENSRAQTFNFNSTSAGNTITMNGCSNGTNYRFAGVGGEWTLQDEMVSGTGSLLLVNGTFISDGNNISIAVTSTGTSTRGYNLAGSTVTTSILNITDITGLTWIPPATIVTNATNAYLYLKGLTVNDIDCQSINTRFVDSLTASNINLNANTTLTIYSGTTTTVDTLTGNGSAGNLCTLVSHTAGVPATISKSSGVVEVDYWSIKDSTATGGALFVARDSTNVSGNTGWIFPSANDAYIIANLGNANAIFEIPIVSATSSSHVNITLTSPANANAIFEIPIVSAVTSSSVEITLPSPANANALMIPFEITVNYVYSSVGNANAVFKAPTIETNNPLVTTASSNAMSLSPTIEAIKNVSITCVLANATAAILNSGLEIWEGKFYQCYVTGEERDVTLTEEERIVTITLSVIAKNTTVI